MIQGFPHGIMSGPLVPNICCDGNSITQGMRASNASYWYPTQVSASPIASSRNVAVTNLGIVGQTGEDMLANHVDVDATWVDGKQNILIAWEITNSVRGGDTPAQAVAAIASYCAAVKLVHPWKIAVITVIPRYQTIVGDAENQANVDLLNLKLNQANELLISGYRAYADYLIDMRYPGSPWNLPDYSDASFSACGLFSPLDPPHWVHPNNTGYTLIAKIVSHRLRVFS